MSAARIFGDPGSPLFTVLGSGSRPRRAQVDYAVAMEALLGVPEGIGMFQGETGSGKTLGYLVPAMLDVARRGGRLVVSTNTIALQDQIIAKAVPAAAAVVKVLTGRDLKFARRIGRRNFISVPAFERAVAAQRAGKANPRLSVVLRRIHREMADDPRLAVRQSVSERYGQVLSELGLPRHFMEGLEIGQHPGDDAPYRDMVAECAAADVIVCNHAFLGMDVIAGGRVMLSRLASEGPLRVVVDEADAFPTMVGDLLSRKLTLRELRAFGRDASPFLSKAAARDLASAIDSLDAAFKDAARDPAAHSSRGNGRVLLLSGSKVPPVAPAIAALLERIGSVIEAAVKKDPFMVSLPAETMALAADIEAFGSSLAVSAAGGRQRGDCFVYWTPEHGWPGLHLDSNESGRVIRRLWDRPEMAPSTLLFTSATLTGGRRRDSMSGFSTELGMFDDARRRVVEGHFAPSSFGAMDFVVADQVSAPPISVEAGPDEETDYPFVSNPVAIDWWASMALAARAEGGRTLVLTTSHRDARHVVAAIAARGGRAILDSRTDGASALRAFASDPSAILVSATRWVGLDMPGMIRHIVITRFPLSPPDLVTAPYREAVLLAKGMDIAKVRQLRFPVSVAKAQRKLLQGVGRGIRTETDSVTIWIGDGRWPLPLSRREFFPNLRAPSWAGAMTAAIPERFAASLEGARVFDPILGARPFVPPGGGGGIARRRPGPRTPMPPANP